MNLARAQAVSRLVVALAALVAAAGDHVQNLNAAAAQTGVRRRREFLAKAARWRALANRGRGALAAAEKSAPASTKESP
jgi:hypothetical protein